MKEEMRREWQVASLQNIVPKRCQQHQRVVLEITLRGGPYGVYYSKIPDTCYSLLRTKLIYSLSIIFLCTFKFKMNLIFYVNMIKIIMIIFIENISPNLFEMYVFFGGQNVLFVV